MRCSKKLTLINSTENGDRGGDTEVGCGPSFLSKMHTTSSFFRVKLRTCEAQNSLLNFIKGPSNWSNQFGSSKFTGWFQSRKNSAISER